MEQPTKERKTPSWQGVQLQDIRQRLAQRNIVLIGLMGAGKTSVGRRLSERLFLRFLDADAEIERAAGKTIVDIFAEHGEAYFREGERRVIARLLEGQGQVIATGGGAYMNPETRALIRARGISIWLKADLHILMARVRKRANRPLLKTADPEATMRSLMDARYPVYAEADVAVESRDVSHDIVVAEAISGLARFLQRRGRAAPRP
jgi:shikimate kinase